MLKRANTAHRYATTHADTGTKLKARVLFDTILKKIKTESMCDSCFGCEDRDKQKARKRR